jgi:leucyl aminopeptidase
MATLKLNSSVSAQTLVIGIASKDGKLVLATASDHLAPKEILPILESLEASSALGATTKVPFSSPKVIIAVGLGTAVKSYDNENLRRAAGSAARALAGSAGADFDLAHNDIEGFSAIAEGADLGAYAFNEFRNASKADHKSPLKSATIITALGSNAATKAALKRASIIGTYTTLVRDLINTPPSHLTPASFAERFKKLASGKALKVEILNETQLRAKGYGGLTGVGQGSANPPRLLHISYNPPKAKKRFAFVGKGITFDSGGYALKPALHMEDMKSDMSGAAAVAAAILAIEELKLPIAIESYACLAENLISDHATRPSDVLTMYGGKTVEVINPDAEGRLVLADGLVRAQEDGRKLGRLDGIIDVATLTGAQVIALGTRTSAVMTNDALLQEAFLDAAELAGEAFWPMPLPEELRPSLESQVADLANMGAPMGKMLVAGLFLKEFIAPDQPWVHLDIAGPALNEGPAYGYTPVGGTGIALRSLITMIEQAV